MTMSIETTVHSYHFDVSSTEGREAWQAFKAERIASGARIFGPVFHPWFGDKSDQNGATVTLETAHLFDNQWNATFPDGREARLFDWFLQAHHGGGYRDSAPQNIRRGHYLAMTDEMRRVRAETAACGYCGKQRPMKGAPAFCPACIGSEYLKPEDFKLTRLRPVAATGDRAPLSAEEQEERLAAYQEAQREGAKTRAGAKLTAFRARVIAKAEKKTRDAATERDGFLWLLEHDLGGLAADNCIFYSHTGRFGFGWRAKLSDDLAAEVMGKLSDEGFPYPYDVETVGEGKLSGMVEG